MCQYQVAGPLSRDSGRGFSSTSRTWLRGLTSSGDPQTVPFDRSGQIAATWSSVSGPGGDHRVGFSLSTGHSRAARSVRVPVVHVFSLRRAK